MRDISVKEVKGILTIYRSGLVASKSNPVLIMIGGFPDSVDTWAKFVPLFENEFHVVAMAFPGMDTVEAMRLEKERKWGYDLDEVVAALLAVVQDYRQAGSTTIFLLGHDWGSFPVLRIASDFPNAVTATVTEDIGIVSPISSLGLKSILIILGYQGLLVMIFIVTRFLPRKLGNWFCLVALSLYPWGLIGPVQDSPSAKPHRVIFGTRPYAMYPYFNLHKRMLLSGNLDPIKPPKSPVLFIYGKQKATMFHTKSFLERLDDLPSSRHIKYEDAGHWIHISHPERMAKDMKLFFKQFM